MQSLRRTGVLAVRRWYKRDLKTRLLDWMSGPQGLIDLFFRGTEITEISISSPLSDIGLTDPVQFKRQRRDELVFESRLRGANNRRQPFFSQDAMPIAYRIPTGDARNHPNSALRISEVRIGELIEASLSNVRITHDPARHLGSMSVTIGTELEVTDQIQGSDFFNADILLSLKPSD